MDQTNNTAPQSGLKGNNFNLIVIFVALAIFATTLPQPQVLGKIPLQHFLKSELHVSRSQMAFFFLVCGLFWYIKPLAGILTDAFPIFGTRRRHYALISAVLAAVSWLALSQAPHTYNAVLLAAVIVNLFMVMLSTVSGAVLVEFGQSTGSVGRLTAVRQISSSICGLIQGPLGGWLATGALAIVCGVNSLFLLALVPVVYFILKEKPTKSNPTESLVNAKRQIATIGKSKTFWWALVFIFLYYFAPGFSTLQYFRQNDVMKLDQPHIGYLASISSAGALLSAVLYVFIARLINLKALLAFGVTTAGVGTFLYILYSSWSNAIWIDFQNGLFSGFAEVALIDLAARATPVGCEGLGYSLILSARNISLFGADYLGSMLADQKHWSWNSMVYLNGGSTLLVLILIPFIPKAVLASRDKARTAEAEAEAA